MPELRAARRPRDELGVRLRERPDVDRPLLDRGAGGVLARAGAEPERDEPGRGRRDARRREDGLRLALGAREQVDRRRRDGGPAGGVAEDVERELVDDASRCCGP